MMTSTKIVKLMLYLHENERTIVDQFQADDWGDFLIVRVKGLNDTTEAYSVYETVQQTLAQAAPNKQIILVPDNLEIEFYGVRVADD